MLEMSLINKLCYLKVHSVSYVQLALVPILPVFLDFILTPTGMDAWSLFTYCCIFTTFTSYLVTFPIFHYHPLSFLESISAILYMLLIVCARTWLPVAIHCLCEFSLCSGWVGRILQCGSCDHHVFMHLMSQHLFPICGVRAADCWSLSHDSSKECLFWHFMFPFKLTVFGLSGGSHTYTDPYHHSGLFCWLRVSCNVVSVVCILYCICLLLYYLICFTVKNYRKKKKKKTEKVPVIFCQDIIHEVLYFYSAVLFRCIFIFMPWALAKSTI